MTNKIFNAITSRTVWATIALFLVTTVPQFEAIIPTEYKPVVQGFLALLVIIFKLNPSKSY